MPRYRGLLAREKSAFVVVPDVSRRCGGGAWRPPVGRLSSALAHMTNPFFSSSLISPLPSSAAMRETLQDRTRLQRMLDFELALARAQAAVGIVPALALDHIASAARAERFDIAALAQAGSIRGHIASALVEALTAEVAKSDQAAARYVHWGATDQDLIDTALVLDLRAAVDALMLDLNRAI